MLSNVSLKTSDTIDIEESQQVIQTAPKIKEESVCEEDQIEQELFKRTAKLKAKFVIRRFLEKEGAMSSNSAESDNSDVDYLESLGNDSEYEDGEHARIFSSSDSNISSPVEERLYSLSRDCIKSSNKKLRENESNSALLNTKKVIVISKKLDGTSTLLNHCIDNVNEIKFQNDNTNNEITEADNSFSNSDSEKGKNNAKLNSNQTSGAFPVEHSEEYFTFPCALADPTAVQKENSKLFTPIDELPDNIINETVNAIFLAVKNKTGFCQGNQDLSRLSLDIRERVTATISEMFGASKHSDQTYFQRQVQSLYIKVISKFVLAGFDPLNGQTVSTITDYITPAKVVQGAGSALGRMLIDNNAAGGTQYLPTSINSNTLSESKTLTSEAIEKYFASPVIFTKPSLSQWKLRERLPPIEKLPKKYLDHIIVDVLKEVKKSVVAQDDLQMNSSKLSFAVKRYVYLKICVLYRACIHRDHNYFLQQLKFLYSKVMSSLFYTGKKSAPPVPTVQIGNTTNLVTGDIQSGNTNNLVTSNTQPDSNLLTSNICLPGGPHTKGIRNDAKSFNVLPLNIMSRFVPIPPNHTLRATPIRATPIRATPIRATPIRATPIRATPIPATPIRATPNIPLPRPASIRSGVPKNGPIHILRATPIPATPNIPMLRLASIRSGVPKIGRNIISTSLSTHPLINEDGTLLNQKRFNELPVNSVQHTASHIRLPTTPLITDQYPTIANVRSLMTGTNGTVPLNSTCMSTTRPPGMSTTRPPGMSTTRPPGMSTTRPPGMSTTRPPGMATTRPPGNVSAVIRTPVSVCRPPKTARTTVSIGRSRAETPSTTRSVLTATAIVTTATEPIIIDDDDTVDIDPSSKLSTPSSVSIVATNGTNGTNMRPDTNVL